jgi:hypothetical protein
MSGRSSSSHFRVYGGPEGGTVASVHPRATTFTAHSDRRFRNLLRYDYVLVEAPDGGKAFVPENDGELRQAFLSASGELDDRETETLAAEMRRRGLDI